MSLTIGLLTILTGFAIMGFGLFLFYAWLPLLYGLIGFDIGILLGRALIGNVGTIVLLFGFSGAVILGAASYFLEPYRRILLGVSGGLLFGFSAAATFGLDGWLGGGFGIMLALVCGFIGGFLVPLIFDLFVIGVSAFGGSAMIMTGAHHILPGVGLFDITAGGVTPALVTTILAVAGVSWQYRNIAKWIQTPPMDRDASHASTKE